jgi:hypothetical protein
MSSDVACNLTAAGRVANVHGILQVQMFRQRSQVIGVVIQVVSVHALTRAPVTTPVVRNQGYGRRHQHGGAAYQDVPARNSGGATGVSCL